MQLIEKEHCYLYGGVFPERVVAGFTKPTISGFLPRDAHKALAFLGGDIGVSYMNQVHGRIIEKADRGKEHVCDGLRSMDCDLALIVKTADCMPMLMHESATQETIAVHMGWRSAKDGILEQIGEDLSSFKVIAGPGLRRCCYRVGDEFLGYKNMARFATRRAEGWYFDPIVFLKETLKRFNLNEDAFSDSGICTACSGHGLFSHRRNATKERTLSFIVNKEGL